MDGEAIGHGIGCYLSKGGMEGVDQLGRWGCKVRGFFGFVVLHYLGLASACAEARWEEVLTWKPVFERGKVGRWWCSPGLEALDSSAGAHHYA